MNNQNVPTPTNQVSGQGQEGGSLQEFQGASLTQIAEEVSVSSTNNGSTPASTDATSSGIHRLILKSTPARIFHFFCSVVASLCSSFVGENYNKEIPYIESYLPLDDGNHSVSAVSSPSNDDSTPSGQDQPISSSTNQEIVRRANNLNNDSTEETRTRNGGIVVSSSQPPSKDPQERLISDCFLHLLSFLPPESIATTEAVSSRWRDEIRSSGSLHQEMNLINLGQLVSIKDFLSHFHHLSSLAQNRLVKVALNLSSFWIDFLLERQVYGDTECHQLLRNCLFQSKDSLREVSLVFRLDEKNFIEFQNSVFPLVNSVLQQLQAYPLLDSICIEGPTGVSFVLHSDQNRFRAFQIKDNFEELENPEKGIPFYDLSSITTYQRVATDYYTDFSLVGPIAEYGKRFIGDGARFTEFGTAWQFLDVGEPPFSSTLDYLSDSISSLKVLKLHWEWSDMELRQIWDFATRCDNLKSLSLDLTGTREEEVARISLNFPEVARTNSNLEVFAVGSLSSLIDWKNASNWLGNNLKVLEIRFQSFMTRSHLHQILKNNARSLTSIDLTSLDCAGDETDGETVQTLNSLSLPNLKSLRLVFLSPSFFEFFATSLDFPNLQELEINLQNEQTPQRSLDCFLAILKANSSTLTFISFSSYETADFSIPSEPLDLKFDQLRDLTIDSRLSLWFSTLASEFPQLSTLWSAESAHDAFQRKSPLLKSLNE